MINISVNGKLRVADKPDHKGSDYGLRVLDSVFHSMTSKYVRIKRYLVKRYELDCYPMNPETYRLRSPESSNSYYLQHKAEQSDKALALINRAFVRYVMPVALHMHRYDKLYVKCEVISNPFSHTDEAGFKGARFVKTVLRDSAGSIEDFTVHIYASETVPIQLLTDLHLKYPYLAFYPHHKLTRHE